MNWLEPNELETDIQQRIDRDAILISYSDNCGDL